MYLIDKFKYNLKRIKYRRSNILISNDVDFESCIFEGGNVIHSFSNVSFSEIGYGTYIGKNSDLIASKIGRFCSIGNNVKLALGKHPLSTFVSTHPSFFSLRKQAGFTYVDKNKFEEFKYVEEGKVLKIGNDVWIGTNVTIFDGVVIGDGAVIGANSLVVRDVEPYSINVGSPAKIVRYRFPQSHISYLLNFKWWDKDLDWIKDNADLFENIEKLKSVYKQ